MYENKDKPILKNESAIKLDAILNLLYNYMSYYGINFEQSINFVRRRYYYLHKSENSYQQNLVFFRYEQERKDSLEKWVNNDRIEEKRE
jgi:hypothetical protein